MKNSLSAWRCGTSLLVPFCCALFGSATLEAQAQPADATIQLFQLLGAEPQTPAGAGVLIRTAPNASTHEAAVWLQGSNLVTRLKLPGLSDFGDVQLQILNSFTNTMAEGEIWRVGYRLLPLDLATELDQGRAHLYDPVPLPRLLVNSLHACPHDPVHPTLVTGRSASTNNETADEKARRLCPDGDCTELVREYVERIIKDLRAQGATQAADLLQELLDGNRFKVDFDREYVNRGQCEVAYYNPFVGKKYVYIAPECLCEDHPGSNIAYLAAALTIWAKDREMDIETAALILAGIILKQEGGLKDIAKMLELMGKLLRAIEGPYPLISCLLQILVDASEYKGSQSEETKEKVKANKDKLERLHRQLKGLSKEELEALIRQLEARLRMIVDLIKARQWELLRLLYGILPGCIDPQVLRFIDRFELKEATSDGAGAVKDLDGDGRHDLTVPQEGNQAVLVARGLTDGTFAPSLSFPVVGGPHQVATGQFDDQASPDLAVATRSRGLVLLLNPMSSSPVQELILPFATNVTVVRVADVNGDGRDDLIAADAGSPTLAVFLQTNAGSFSHPLLTAVATPPHDLVLGEWSGDGWLDLVVADGRALRWYKNEGNNPAESAWLGWVPCGDFPFATPDTRLTLADIDGDLDLDVLALDRELGRVRGFLQQPPRGALLAFDPGRILNLPGSGDALAVEDVNRDGLPDLLAGTRMPNPQLLMYEGVVWRDPTQRLIAPAVYELSGAVTGLHLEDLDEDGSRDLLVQQDNGAHVFLRYFTRRDPDCELALAIRRGSSGSGVELILPEARPGGTLGILHADEIEGPWRRLFPERMDEQFADSAVVRVEGVSGYFRLVETFCLLELTGPRDASVPEGARATFAVGIERNLGGQPTFQWQRAGAAASAPFVDIPGANMATYETPPLALLESGHRFRCRVDNGCGETISSAAVLVVQPSTEQ